MTLKTANSLLESTFVEMRDTNKSCILKYDIPFLDEVTGGIFKDNLVLVGARSGEGKSELVSQIAYKTAISGKKVIFFNLEDGEEGFIRRAVSLKLSRKLGKNFSPIDFRTNDILVKYENEVIQCFKEVKEELSGNIKIYSSNKIPSIDDFISIIGEEDADLIAVDHLHYFSMHQSSDTQATQLATIMRKIRTLTKTKKIPVIMAAHLSKPLKQEKAPCKYDFHGSSDIAKEATVCILLWRREDHTEIILDKNRDGRYLKTAYCNFDPKKGGFHNFSEQAGFSEHSGVDNAPTITF